MRTSTVQRRGLAERGDFAGLEEAEKLGLEVEAEFADFVEEEGAVAGGADEAEVVAVGAGEGAAAVAEELAFEQVARNGGAVERDERLLGAVGEVVNGAGEDLLAGAAFAGDQHVDRSACHLLCAQHYLVHLTSDNGASGIANRFVWQPKSRPALAVDSQLLQFVKSFNYRSKQAQRGFALNRRFGM